MPPVLKPLQARWRQLVHNAPEHGFAPIERARQVQAVMRLTPLALLANVVNVALVGHAMWGPASRSMLLVWAALVLMLCMLGMRAWWRMRRHGARPRASVRATRRAVLHASALALAWAAAPVALLPQAEPSQQLLLATVVTGMICAGGFALAPMPWAGTAYALILGAGSALALFRTPIDHRVEVGSLLVIYTGIVVASVWSTARTFGARVRAEHEARQHLETVSLLLRDFETHAADLLWELDAELALRHGSPALERLLAHETAGAHARASMIERLRALVPADGRAQFDALALKLAGREAFRDQPLSTARGETRRWWSLSARPLFDAEGRFDGWRGVATDVSEQRLATERLDQMAHEDALTGLANRRALCAAMAERLGARPAQALAVVCLDLDGFKAVNDTLGHAVGDALLQRLAQRLRAHQRPGELPARLGGDEFAWLIPGRHNPAALEARVRALLDDLRRPDMVRGTRLAMRGSAGIALAPAHGHDLDTLLTHADLALYAAKTSRHGVRVFDESLAAGPRRRRELEQGLRSAVAEHQLTLAYMPQIDARSGQVSGFEALLRWQHPRLGEVAPGEFIPVAEAAGMIDELGQWALVQACREAASWPAPLRLAVNVSAAQVQSGRLADQVDRALESSGLAPQRLEVEITESVLMHDPDEASRRLQRLRQRGVRVALDDFGTGYSALAYLRRLEFDTLKVHASFTAELDTRADARLILRMIVRLGQALRLATVVEGVENAAQARALRRLGCDRLQGFGLAAPLGPQAIAAFLAGWQPRAARRGGGGGAQPGETVPGALPGRA